LFLGWVNYQTNPNGTRAAATTPVTIEQSHLEQSHLDGLVMLFAYSEACRGTKITHDGYQLILALMNRFPEAERHAAGRKMLADVQTMGHAFCSLIRPSAEPAIATINQNASTILGRQ